MLAGGGPSKGGCTLDPVLFTRNTLLSIKPFSQLACLLILSCLLSLPVHPLSLFQPVCAASPQANSTPQEVPDVNRKVEAGLTPLMFASTDGQLDQLRTLLKNGADVNAKDDYGWTPLTYAVSNSHLRVVNPLLESGADLNIVDSRGITPLMWAAFNGKEHIVSTLLAKGANVNAVANSGATALTFAEGKGHNTVARLLKNAGGNGPQIHKSLFPVSSAPVDTTPKMLNRPRPVYTEEARHNKTEGTVKLRILIDTDGRVRKVKVIKELPDGLTEAAIRAASEMKFKPAFSNGRPVMYWMRVEVAFNRG